MCVDGGCQSIVVVLVGGCRSGQQQHSSLQLLHDLVGLSKRSGSGQWQHNPSQLLHDLVGGLEQKNYIRSGQRQHSSSPLLHDLVSLSRRRGFLQPVQHS